METAVIGENTFKLFKWNYLNQAYIILPKVFTYPSKPLNSGVPIISMATGV